MSGGSYNYIYREIDNFNDEFDVKNCAKRMAFKKLMTKVSRAMHDIEWVDSCDYGSGDEIKAIDDVFTFLMPDKWEVAKAIAFDNIKELTNSFGETDEKEL